MSHFNCILCTILNKRNLLCLLLFLFFAKAGHGQIYVSVLHHLQEGRIIVLIDTKILRH